MKKLIKMSARPMQEYTSIRSCKRTAERSMDTTGVAYAKFTRPKTSLFCRARAQITIPIASINNPSHRIPIHWRAVGIISCPEKWQQTPAITEADANGTVLGNRSGGEPPTGERRGCGRCGIPVQQMPGVGRGLSPECTPDAGFLPHL